MSWDVTVVHATPDRPVWLYGITLPEVDNGAPGDKEI